MLHAFRSLVSPELSIAQILPQADKAVLVARSKSAVSFCPGRGRQTRRAYSHYVRRLDDLPWQGRVWRSTSRATVSMREFAVLASHIH
ncbi:hypothetical protein [Bradyrhizobium viridifuturi]|uniref:hypothetical protein n=1 Tax=Bradyrhizobium viridifuturi TaxID=1654716 RepID=UPI001AEC2C5A|nr:hypothetical protein [Bradyrhizobium viridifuturi]